jgi:hypothetical protein
VRAAGETSLGAGDAAPAGGADGRCGLKNPETSASLSSPKDGIGDAPNGSASAGEGLVALPPKVNADDDCGAAAAPKLNIAPAAGGETASASETPPGEGVAATALLRLPRFGEPGGVESCVSSSADVDDL